MSTLPDPSVTAEKEKTKRYYGFLITGGVLALIIAILFFSVFRNGGGTKGSLEINKDGIKVTLEQPLIQQVDPSTSVLKYKDERLEFTTGRIERQTIDSVVRASPPISPLTFSGSNLIDVRGGFVIASSHANEWRVVHDSAGYNQYTTPIVELHPQQPQHNESVIVSRTPMSAIPNCTNIRCGVDFITTSLPNSMARNEKPIIEFDDVRKTALLFYPNNRDGRSVLIKVVIANGFLYQAVAEFGAGTDRVSGERAKAMVASFAVIE